MEGFYINLGALRASVERAQSETVTIQAATVKALLDHIERLEIALKGARQPRASGDADNSQTEITVASQRAAARD